MNRTSIALVALLVTSPFAPAAERSSLLPVVYYSKTATPGVEAEALVAYRRQYNVLTPGKNDRFTPPMVTTRTYPRTAPGGALLTNGTVRLAAIVTVEGRVTKAMVLKAPDDYTGLSVLGVLGSWRCQPGQLNGMPVAAVLIYDLDVQRSGARDYPRHDEGLGHLPHQDR